MNFTENSTLVDFLNNLGQSDLYSFTLVINAYIDNCSKLNIDDVGFNTYTGDVYIGLENGILITSRFGQEVEYSINYLGMDLEEDPIFNTYYEAVEYLKTI